mmetsp:Transcript_58861/g.138387  ORF Transcript_58861/g.138387 Transcript_58861/m.138387 type:complete len:284 (-) Transcript_58861:580-1431(-)
MLPLHRPILGAGKDPAAVVGVLAHVLVANVRVLPHEVRHQPLVPTTRSERRPVLRDVPDIDAIDARHVGRCQLELVSRAPHDVRHPVGGEEPSDWRDVAAAGLLLQVPDLDVAGERVLGCAARGQNRRKHRMPVHSIHRRLFFDPLHARVRAPQVPDLDVPAVTRLQPDCDHRRSQRADAQIARIALDLRGYLVPLLPADVPARDGAVERGTEEHLLAPLQRRPGHAPDGTVRVFALPLELLEVVQVPEREVPSARRGRRTCNDVGGGRMPSNVFDVSPLVRA